MVQNWIIYGGRLSLWELGPNHGPEKNLRSINAILSLPVAREGLSTCRPRAGCCGFEGPFPQPLWIRFTNLLTIIPTLGISGNQ